MSKKKMTEAEFKAKTGKSPKEALEAAREQLGHPDLKIKDVVSPNKHKQIVEEYSPKGPKK